MFGVIEYALLPWTTFGKDVSPDTPADEICDIVFSDILREDHRIVGLQEEINGIKTEMDELKLDTLRIDQGLNDVTERISKPS